MNFSHTIEIAHEPQPVFSTYMKQLHQFDSSLNAIEVIEQRSITDNDEIARTTYRYTASLPMGLGWTGMLLRRAIGDHALQWDEHGHWNHEQLSCRWSIEPCSSPDALTISCSGSNQYRAVADQTHIDVSGELVLKGLPGAERAEPFVINQVRQNLDSIGRALEAYLD